MKKHTEYRIIEYVDTSSTTTVSKLIETLQQVLKEHGDLDVRLEHDASYYRCGTVYITNNYDDPDFVSFM